MAEVAGISLILTCEHRVNEPIKVYSLHIIIETNKNTH